MTRPRRRETDLTLRQRASEVSVTTWVLYGLMFAIAIVLAAYVGKVERIATQNASNLRLIKANSVEARNQFCLGLEKAHARDVRQLAGTYAYLARLPDSELDAPITKAIVAGIAKTEQDAADLPPAVCLPTTVGLPAPPPPVPKRPSSLVRILPPVAPPAPGSRSIPVPVH